MVVVNNIMVVVNNKIAGFQFFSNLLNPDLWSTNREEPFKVWIQGFKTNPWLRETNPRFLRTSYTIPTTLELKLLFGTGLQTWIWGPVCAQN
jgi:hypothetical protein